VIAWYISVSLLDYVANLRPKVAGRISEIAGLEPPGAG
jgi:hypothetical protein